MTNIHPTALVDPAAEVAEDAEIGPFSVIGPKVRIGSGSWIGAHVMVTGRTTIGDNTTIREMCTFSRGSMQGGGKTIIGNDNWIMACVHIAHDCILGDHIIMANNTSLAGHVTVGDWAILSGYSLIHQFCTVGEHSFTSFASYVNRSIPPYVTVSGEKARAKGVNVEGLKRRGYSKEQIQRVRRAYKLLYRSGIPLDEATDQLVDWAREHDEIKPLVDFLEVTEKSFLR